MPQAYEERERAAAENGCASVSSDGSGVLPPPADLRIKEGEKLQLSLPVQGGESSAGFVSRSRALGKSFSLILDERGGMIAGLSPPPSARGSAAPPMAVSPASSDGGSPVQRLEQQRQHKEQQQQQQRTPSGGGGAEGLAQGLGGLALHDAGGDDAGGDDAAPAANDWGEFEEAPPSR